ncbi:endospore germination permease [Paenibacillus sp. CF384]|uniref:GerAB/ArcD/ProY family transporter n=1 Tax=Paenibacillus sp. CF384 TaxID=1884382 RepID=UPI00089507A2|nr:endospore germination permease [Paenibacillus sp. CF384]SDW22972.1 spore germination protein KB [Paenibacillus sp. CF384]
MTDMNIAERQLFWIMTSTQITMTLLLTTAPTIQIASQDAWISALIATGAGLLIALVCAKTALRFPGMTVILYSDILFGRWIGRAIGFLYMIFWLVLLTVILKQFAFFLSETILPETPMPVIIAMMLAVILYPTLHGVGVIARCCEVIGPIVMGGVIFPVVLSVNNMELQSIRPFFGDVSVFGILKGSIPTLTFLGDCVLLVMIIAFVKSKGKTVKYAVSGVLVSGLFTMLSIIASLLSFGPMVSQSNNYPLMMLVRAVSLGGIIENLDAIAVTIWIMSVFTKLALYLFISGHGSAQLFGVRNWKRMTWIIACIAYGITLIPLNVVETSIVFPQKIAVRFMLPIFMIGLPLLMWGLAAYRQRTQYRQI